MKITAIVAMDSNRSIGNAQTNDIPWHLPLDFKHFKKNTIGKVLIMGRKTFESIGKPLPDRFTIVLSSQFCQVIKKNLSENESDQVNCVKSIDEGIKAAIRHIEIYDLKNEIMICGGASIYEQSKHLWTDMMITDVHFESKGNIKFPKINYSEWGLMRDKEYPDTDHEHGFTISHYKKLTDSHMVVV